MIGRLLGLVFFIFIGFMVWNLLKLIFQLGRASGEINRKFESMNRAKRDKNSGKKDKVIELDRDQYKVE